MRTAAVLRMAMAGPTRPLPRNYYEVLGVERTATAAEIKQAFYTLSKRVRDSGYKKAYFTKALSIVIFAHLQYHPDSSSASESTVAGKDRVSAVGAGPSMSQTAGSTYHEIAEAYTTLRDEGRRAGYDLQLLQEEGLYGSRSYRRSHTAQQHSTITVGHERREGERQRGREQARFSYENRRHFVNPTEEMEKERRDRRLTVMLGGGFLGVVVFQFAYLHFSR